MNGITDTVMTGVRGGTTPRPDPTVLTTEQLMREIAALRREFEGALEAILVRIEAMDKANDLKLQTLHDMPKRINEEVSHLEALIDEKLRSVENSFDLVERGRVEQKVDTKAAVDAALIAQKEAVKEQTTASERAIAKSEAATTKQIDELNKTFSTLIEGVRREMGDLKERIGDVDASTRVYNASSVGGDTAKVRFQGTVFAVAGVVGTIVIIALTVIALVL